MQNIYESDFQKLQLDPAHGLWIQIWKPETAELDEHTYREETFLILQHARQNPGAFFLYSDASRFLYTIPPALQAWTATEITPKVMQTGIRKHAIRPAADFFSHVSGEQMVEDVQQNNQHYSINFVPDFQAALQWFGIRNAITLI